MSQLEKNFLVNFKPENASDFAALFDCNDAEDFVKLEDLSAMVGIRLETKSDNLEYLK